MTGYILLNLMAKMAADGAAAMHEVVPPLHGPVQTHRDPPPEFRGEIGDGALRQAVGPGIQVPGPPSRPGQGARTIQVQGQDLEYGRSGL